MKHILLSLLFAAAFVSRVSAQDMPITQVIIDGKGWELVGQGYKFTEGPAADAQGNVFFTDQPNNRILKWSTDGKFIATGTQENDIHVWRIAQATDMRMQGYPAKVKSLSWSADARWLYTSSQPVFTAWSFAGKGPEGKPPLQFGDEGAGLFTVVAAHPAAEFAAGGYDSGELQLGDIKARRSVVLKMSDGSPITCLAWSSDGFLLAAGNEKGDLLTIDLRR